MSSWFPWMKKKDNFVDSADAARMGISGIHSFNNTALPDSVYSSDKNLDLENLTKTLNTGPSAYHSFVENEKIVNISGYNPPTALNASSKAGIPVDTLNERQRACEGTGNGDQFEHLSNLAANQDPSSDTRCLWIYNHSNPANGRGAYGTIDGPFHTTTTGERMWDLNAAKKKYHEDMCSKVKNCGDITSKIYAGRCGWDSLAGKAVPVIGGRVAYPGDTRISPSSSNLVTSDKSCPVSPPTTIIYDKNGNTRSVTNSASICTPLENGNLSRNCLMQKIRDAGCSDKGTLITALNNGSDGNYIDRLSKSKAYTIYQDRATNPLNETALRKGTYQTTGAALDEFKNVEDLSAANLNTGLGYASRDLCLQSGTIDTFDFCTELTDTSKPPFTLDCLQKAFLKAGGQLSGSQYPTASNYADWNRMENWKAVNDRISNLLSSARGRARGNEGFTNPKFSKKREGFTQSQEYAECQAQKESLSNLLGQTTRTDCTPPPRVDTSTDSAFGKEVHGNENDTASISCDSGIIEYIHLKYGKNGRYREGNSQNGPVSKYCNGKKTCSIQVTNSSGLGDTNPGVFKDFVLKPRCKVDYRYEGCHGDNGLPNSRAPNSRALPKNLAIGQASVTSIDQCYGLASANGYDQFGVQFGGECWAGKSSEINQDKDNRNPRRYGAVDESKCKTRDNVFLGGAHTNMLYSIDRKENPNVMTVGGNDGSVSCETYCGGTNGGPWNNVLPRDWNGAKCIGTPNNPGLGCNSGFNGGLVCTCQKTGTGWN